MQGSYLYRPSQSNYHILLKLRIYEKGIYVKCKVKNYFEGRSSHLYICKFAVAKRKPEKKIQACTDSNP